MPATRFLIYLCTFISGAVALVFQIVWQRYLAVLLGSEAKSVSLMVAVFLFGLAAGYRFWGNLTERDWSRRRLLKTLGFVELGIAAYGLAFPQWFGWVQAMAYAGPDSLLYDMLVTALLLLVPTFLMGASVPLLTAALPERAEEVNSCHARVYGINTLGAVLGCFAGGFIMAPMLGLPMSLVLGALADIAIGLYFVLNRLEGSSHPAEDIPRIPNAYGTPGIMLFVFVTGAVSIALEVLFMRVMSLTAGPSHTVFPTVVGVVVLGLAIGSLSLRKRQVTAQTVPHELIKLAIILGVVHLTIPYWPYWLNHVRISLSSIPSNYWVFQVLTVLFVAAFLLPLIIPLGRLLPTGYALLDKSRDDFGKQCGRLYFSNTLGTVTGAVVIGYLGFMFLSLPALLLLNVSLLLVMAALLCWRSRRLRVTGFCVLAAAAVWLAPKWDRKSHIVGLFRTDQLQEFHFRGLFHVPAPGNPLDLKLLRDDPTMTVAAYEIPARIPGIQERTSSMTIAVNGKSDGNTIADYSNMVLAGIIPYLFCTTDAQLDAAVVGLGTGMTSGALVSGSEMATVTTLEISPSVVQAAPLFSDANFGLSSNPKSTVVLTDAFRFFTRAERAYDIIVSEPSNPWVVGVENLFTPEFYRMVSGRLEEGGVFFQWIQLYEINNEVFNAIARNVVTEFEHAALFVIGGSDVGILASHHPIDRRHIARRMAEPGVRAALAPMGIADPALISILEAYQTAHMAVLAMETERPVHSVEFPWLGHAAAKAKFLTQQGSLGGPVLRGIGRHLRLDPRRYDDFRAWMERHDGDIDSYCEPDRQRFSVAFLCGLLQPLAQAFAQLQRPATLEQVPDMIAAYDELRDQGRMPQDLALLDRLRALIQTAQPPPATSPELLAEATGALVVCYAREFKWDIASEIAGDMHIRGLISDAERAEMRQSIKEHQERSMEWLERLRPVLEP